MRRGSQQGFAYLLVFFALAVVGVGLAAAGTAWSETTRREREDELLRVGTQYAEAIAAYRRNSPGSEKAYPRALEDLLDDRRLVGTHRYMRQLYRDPVTGKPGWGTVRAFDGGIEGVYSLSEATPLRRTAIEAGRIRLAAATRYSDWKFVAPADADPAAQATRSE